MQRSRIQVHSEITLFIIFLMVIFVPLITTLFASGSGTSDMEKRRLAAMPQISLNKRSLEEFPSKFEAYYNDHFGLRRAHLLFNNYIKAKILKSSPVSKVLIGKDNWLYIVRAKEIKDFQGLIKPKPMQLEAWKVNFRNKRDWLMKRGIRYLYMIAPNKGTIYPEYLPYYIKKIEFKTQFDQLLEYLDGEFDQEILDLRPVLIQAKQKELVYYRSDTHWNQKGAYIACQSILERLQTWFPHEKTLSPAPVIETTKVYKGLDLATMLGLPKTYQEVAPLVTLKNKCAMQQEDVKLPKLYVIENVLPFQMECQKANLRAVVFRDSFFASIVPYFSENFRQIVYIWHQYDQDALEQILKQFKPDVVIEECGEGGVFLPYSEEFCQSILGKTSVEN